MEVISVLPKQVYNFSLDFVSLKTKVVVVMLEFYIIYSEWGHNVLLFQKHILSKACVSECGIKKQLLSFCLNFYRKKVVDRSDPQLILLIDVCIGIVIRTSEDPAFLNG